MHLRISRASSLAARNEQATCPRDRSMADARIHREFADDRRELTRASCRTISTNMSRSPRRLFKVVGSAAEIRCVRDPIGRTQTMFDIEKQQNCSFAKKATRLSPDDGRVGIGADKSNDVSSAH
jgi:hypothetical protein